MMMTLGCKGLNVSENTAFESKAAHWRMCEFVFPPVILTRWPWYTNLTWILR